jgi:hypothetical protein
MTSGGRKTNSPSYRTIQAESIGPKPHELKVAFPPPYAELAVKPSAFQYQWELMEYAFALPDPSTFPMLELPMAKKDLDAIARYIHSCRELATYSLLGADRSLSLSQRRGEPVHMEVSMPPKEILRGFAILFRQIHSKDPAGYEVVKSVLESSLSRERPTICTAGREQVAQWRRARAKLLQFTLGQIVQTKVIEAEWPADAPLPSSDNTHSPTELISMFQYGEYIHWGEKREKHEALFRVPAFGTYLEFQFHDAQIGLSHFYLGFAKLAEAAIGDQLGVE